MHLLFLKNYFSCKIKVQFKIYWVNLQNQGQNTENTENILSDHSEILSCLKLSGTFLKLLKFQ